MFLKYYFAVSLISLLLNSKHAAAHEITQTEEPARVQSLDNFEDEKEFPKYIPEIEQKIIETITKNFDDQNENILIPKLEMITELEYVIKNIISEKPECSCNYTNISETVNKKLTELQNGFQAMEDNRTRDLTELQNGFQAMEDNRTRDLTELQNGFQAMEDNRTRDMTELTDTVRALRLQLAAQGSALEAIRHRLLGPENKTEPTNGSLLGSKSINSSDVRNIQDTQNSTARISTSVSATANESEAGSSLCGVPVPSRVRARRDIWDEYSTPVPDELDEFLENSTGCTYEALAHDRRLTSAAPPAALGDSTWRGFVRAPPPVELHLEWGSALVTMAAYTITIQENDIRIKKSKFLEGQKVLGVRSTPGLLSADRYVPLTVRRQGGTLTLSVECGGAPLFTYSRLDGGSRDVVVLRARSVLGAKLLHECPPRP